MCISQPFVISITIIIVNIVEVMLVIIVVFKEFAMGANI